MKKFLAALLIGAFTLTGIGCSGEKDKDKKPADKPAVDSTKPTTDAATKDKKPAEKP